MYFNRWELLEIKDALEPHLEGRRATVKKAKERFADADKEEGVVRACQSCLDYAESAYAHVCAEIDRPPTEEDLRPDNIGLRVVRVNHSESA